MPLPTEAERNAAIVARYREGATMRGIAAEFGVTAERVRQLLHRHGVTAAESIAKRPPKLPEWFFEAWRRRDAGESVRDIARALGRGESYVRETLLRGGVSTERPNLTNRPGQPWRCTKCKRGEAEGARFHRDNDRSRGKQANCTDCVAAYQIDYYRRNADTIKAKARAKRAAQREQPEAAD